MKSTGVVRRIDELGRIVIPKEIRRNLGIRDGESLEIFVDSDQILLKKYSKILEIEVVSEKLCEYVKDILGLEIFITDRDYVITDGTKDEISLKGKEISRDLFQKIENRELYVSKELEKIQLGNLEVEGYFVIQPILCSTDSLGLVILKEQEKPKENLFSLVKFLAQILGDKLDIS